MDHSMHVARTRTAGGLASLPRVGQLRVGSAWLLAVALLGVYLVTGSQRYDPDVLPELTAIKHLAAAQPDPAHMLYVRLGVAVYSAWRDLGYAGDPLRPMQAVNAVFGAGTILLFVQVLRRFACKDVIVLLVGTSVALSYTFWMHTVDAFFIIPACFFSMLALLLSISSAEAGTARRRRLLATALGVGVGLSVLFYQANSALLPALLAASWPRGRHPWRGWLETWLLAGGVSLLVAGGFWLIQGLTTAGVRSPSEFVQWLLFSHGGMRNALWRREGVNLLTTVPIAWAASVLPVYRGLGLRELAHGTLALDRLVAQLGFGLLVTVPLAAAALIVSKPSSARGSAAGRRTGLVFGLWSVVPGLAVVWFDPAETKLWLIPLLGAWAWLAIILSAVASDAQRWRRVSALALGAALAVVVPLSNLTGAIWPDHVAASHDLELASAAASRMRHQDRLVSMTFDWTQYVPYVADEQSVVHGIAIAQSHGKDNVKSLMWTRLAEVWAQGGRVYIVDYFSPDQPDYWSGWITPYTHLTQADFEVFPRRVAWQQDTTTVWELLPPG